MFVHVLSNLYIQRNKYLTICEFYIGPSIKLIFIAQ